MDEARTRHLRWCLDAAEALGLPRPDDVDAWRSVFDQLADELRAALTWTAGSAGHRAEAYRLAIWLADLTFVRGTPGESQRRYEQAAELAADDRTAAAALHRAAGAAETRHFGTDAMRLRRAAADAALRAGDRAGAARDLARAAELINRGPGLMAKPPAIGEVDALLREAWVLAAGDPAAEARTLNAEAYKGTELDPITAELAERAITLARRVGDPLDESAALDELTAIQLARGEVRPALESAMLRTRLLAPLQVTAASGLEFFDAYIMATDCAVAAGDLAAARPLAERVCDLPFYREEAHLATARLLLVAALTGEWDEAVSLGERFRKGWERAGRPRAGNLSRGAYAVATVHGLRGDDDERARWLDVVDRLATPGRPLSSMHFNEFFDAMLLLHRGRADEAMQTLSTPPEHFREWHNGMWRPWYAALWAEAAVLTGAPGRERAHRPGATRDHGQPGRRRHRRPCSGHGGRRSRDTGLRGRRPESHWMPLSVGPHARPHRGWGASARGVRTGRNGCDTYGLASRIRLNGVSAARRTRLNPASRSTSVSRDSPACAPSARPTSCASEFGVQITVDRP